MFDMMDEYSKEAVLFSVVRASVYLVNIITFIFIYKSRHGVLSWSMSVHRSVCTSRIMVSLI